MLVLNHVFFIKLVMNVKIGWELKKIPIIKSQIPNKFQYPNHKHQGIGIWDLFGICYLELGFL